MSRQAFGSILRNEDELLADDDDADDEGLCDTQDFSLSDWLDDGVVGWDEPLQTYFVHAVETDDGPVWWFGTSPREIPTFADLCKVINRAFGDRVKFDFVDTIERK
jgi:hypothetical protein